MPEWLRARTPIEDLIKAAERQIPESRGMSAVAEFGGKPDAQRRMARAFAKTQARRSQRRHRVDHRDAVDAPWASHLRRGARRGGPEGIAEGCLNVDCHTSVVPYGQ